MGQRVNVQKHTMVYGVLQKLMVMRRAKTRRDSHMGIVAAAEAQTAPQL